KPAIAQLYIRHCARPGRSAEPRQARRGRVHRAGPDRTGGFAERRYAGIKCGRGDPGWQGDDRRGDRRSADAAVQGGGMTMAYWLVKSEPSVWSWDQQVAKGAKGEAWTGVRNFTARQNLVAMKKGDKAFFYHSNEGKEIVGIAEVIKEAYPDPSDKTGKFVCVDIKADKPLKTPVTMAAIKADKTLAEMALVKFSRLSAQPVTAGVWKLVCKMGRPRPAIRGGAAQRRTPRATGSRPSCAIPLSCAFPGPRRPTGRTFHRR